MVSRILIFGLLAVVMAALVACGGGEPTPRVPMDTLTPFVLSETMSPSLQEWTEVFRDAANAEGLYGNTAAAIRSSDPQQEASLACASMFNRLVALEEVREAAWRSARAFPAGGHNDILAASNYATMQVPNVCWDDDKVRVDAFGDGPFTKEPLATPAPTPTPAAWADHDPNDCFTAGERAYVDNIMEETLEDVVETLAALNLALLSFDDYDLDDVGYRQWAGEVLSEIRALSALGDKLKSEPSPSIDFDPIVETIRWMGGDLGLIANYYTQGVEDLNLEKIESGNRLMEFQEGELEFVANTTVALCDSR